MENITFEQLPKAVTFLTKEISELKTLLIGKLNQSPSEETKKLLSIDEIADFLNLSKQTIYSKVSKNEIPGVCKQGKRLYFDYQIILEWLKQGRKKSNAEIEAEAKEFLNNKKGLKDGK